MVDRMIVTFVQKYGPYNAGECAGFAQHISESLIKAGVAKSGGGPKPKPDEAQAGGKR